MSTLRNIAYAALFATAALAISNVSAAPKGDTQSVERGRYIAKIAGCNDCHTAGYLLSAGKVPEKDWLMGDSFGWRGDWGTTYPPNLRMYMANISEDQWIENARALRARPPMPYYVVNEMHEADLRALYRFVKSLGPVGTQAPAYVPPGETPKGPYAQFPSVPK